MRGEKLGVEVCNNGLDLQMHKTPQIPPEVLGTLGEARIQVGGGVREGEGDTAGIVGGHTCFEVSWEAGMCTCDVDVKRMVSVSAVGSFILICKHVSFHTFLLYCFTARAMLMTRSSTTMTIYFTSPQHNSS